MSELARLESLKSKFENIGMKANIKMKKVIHNLRLPNHSVVEKGMELGLNKLEATILANRTTDINNLSKYISPRYSDIMDFKLLTDIDKATDIIIDSINKNELIMFVTDFDSDGIPGANIASLFCRDVIKYNNYKCLINKRIHGNGINDVITKEILEIKPSLIISIDHGSSNGKQIDLLMDNGIKCIITDHHEVSLETPPNKYNAFINPQREDCKYDKSVSGCTVAYLLILSLCSRFNIDPINNPHMQNILAITSITTISDAMKLNTITNRAIVKTGLKIANRQPTDNWKRLLVDTDGLVTYKTYGWQIAPRINSCSRMGNPDAAYRIFIEKEDRDIREALTKVEELNNDRKKTQEDMSREAIDQYLIDTDSNYAIALKVDTGFGIQGIVANRLASTYNLPTVVFYHNKKENKMQGSGRSANGIMLLNILRKIASESNGKVLACGGHKEAAGITIAEDFLPEFKRLFNKFVEEDTIEKYGDSGLGAPIKHLHLVDAELAYLDYSILDSINLLAPYGQAWDEPLFSTIFKVKRATRISRPKNNDMYILHLIDSKGTFFEATYFIKSGEDIEVRDGMELNVIYSLEYSGARGKGLNMQIKDMSEY